MPGLKSAVAFAGPDAAADLARLPEEVGHGPSHIAVLAHTAALRDGRGWRDEVLAGLDSAWPTRSAGPADPGRTRAPGGPSSAGFQAAGVLAAVNAFKAALATPVDVVRPK